MKINLDNNLYDFIKMIAKNARKQNKRVFFVGGYVRDYIMHKVTKDIDLIIEGNAIDFCKNLEDEIEIKSIHKDFATVKVFYQNQIIDIASTRTETYPHFGSLPEVKNIGVLIKDDVKRRDFTINSLYIEIKYKNDSLDFELIDLVKGIDDINKKTLRVLHEKSYQDDPTRILRGLDFKYRFGFDFSLDDKKLIKETIKNINFDNSSKDRIKNVFLKILSTKNADYIFKDIIDNKIYKILFKNKPVADYKKIDEVIEKFKLTDKSKFYFDILQNEDVEIIPCNNILDIYNNFSKKDINFLIYYYYKTNDKNIDTYLKIKDTKLKTKGKDLINLNYPKGKYIGEILKNLLSEKLKQQELFKTKKDEIDWVLKNYPIL